MITNVAVVGVFVSDEDKALDFYVNKLGFEKRADEPMGDGLRWIEVAPPGATTCIVLTRGYGDWSQEKVGQFAGIVFEPDDINATYQELSARGVEFTEPPTAQPWGGVQALFKDQDGNTFVLVQR
jgi:catechol 2,3-dioxygenase-like lactoylglutathione lyase family enzyme